MSSVNVAVSAWKRHATCLYTGRKLYCALKGKKKRTFRLVEQARLCPTTTQSAIKEVKEGGAGFWLLLPAGIPAPIFNIPLSIPQFLRLKHSVYYISVFSCLMKTIPHTEYLPFYPESNAFYQICAQTPPNVCIWIVFIIWASFFFILNYCQVHMDTHTDHIKLSTVNYVPRAGHILAQNLKRHGSSSAAPIQTIQPTGERRKTRLSFSCLIDRHPVAFVKLFTQTDESSRHSQCPIRCML